MVLDPTGTTVQTNVRTERPAPYAGAEQASRLRANRQETGQTSSATADVVKISAAALQASRAVTQPSRPADQGATEETVRESERRESPARQQLETRARSERPGKAIDLMA